MVYLLAEVGDKILHPIDFWTLSVVLTFVMVFSCRLRISLRVFVFILTLIYLYSCLSDASGIYAPDIHEAILSEMGSSYYGTDRNGALSGFARDKLW